MIKKISFMLISIIIIMAFGLGLYPNDARAKDAEQGKDIILACSTSMTGPIAFLGQNLVLGIKACFNDINDHGGINGHKIKLIIKDDRYSVPLVQSNTQYFIDKIKPLALIGYCGTPTTISILDMIQKAHLPLVGPYTGGHQLRLPYRHYLFNVRNSYWAEVAALVEYAVDTLKKDRIAVFYQNAAYGVTGYKGVLRTLAVEYNKDIVAHAVYDKGHSIVSKLAIDTICTAKPQVVIMISTSGATSDFVKKCKKRGLKAVFMTISPAGTKKLINLMGSDADNIIASEVMPSPNAVNLPFVKDYDKLMHKYFPSKQLTFPGLEGFVNAKVMAEGLRRSKDIFNSDSLTNALASLKNYKLGPDCVISYGKRDREGLSVVYLTRIKNGKFHVIKILHKQIHLYIY